MNNFILPAIWLIVLIVGLPHLSETVYTPSLPDIAKALQTSESMVEYTLTIFLFGFAIGTLFWGNISDKLGRKPCVIAGLIVFILGCVGCYLGTTIEILMISRFIQAFGGSIGSVLGQAICRDAFHGPVLGKVYSSIGSALALFPALGPVVGGVVAENMGWRYTFLFLLCFAILLVILILRKLPETHPVMNRKSFSFLKVALTLMLDKKVMGFGLIVAACNGILFSYFAEGSFYFIKSLGLTPSAYGLSFMLISAATMAGGMLSKKLHATHSSKVIMSYGINGIMIASTIFSTIAIIHQCLWQLSACQMIIITLLSQMGIAFSVCVATSNALALALVNYKHVIGTASSLFGFFYYCLISLFTLGMGFLHNGTLLVMPLYFFALSLLMVFVKKFMLEQ